MLPPEGAVAEGSSNLPITFGSLTEATADPLGLLRRLYERHGPISALQDRDQRVIFVFGPEFNQRVLSDTEVFHSYFFPLRGPKGSAQRRLTSGLLSQNGSRHREQRRLLMGPFQKRAFPEYLPVIQALTEEMLATWRVGQTRDMHVEMNRLMLRIASSLLFGFDRSELVFELGEMIEHWGALNHRLGTAALTPQPCDYGDYEELLAYAEQLERRIRQLIHDRRQDPRGDDVLAILLRSEEQGGKLTEDELIGQTALLFSAAHLTTAHTLTWAFFLLAQHPREGDRLTREIAAANPADERPASGEEPTVLDRVVKETLRILPGSAYVQRVAVKPVGLGPFRVNRGTVVAFSQFMTHHMRELYAEPERFLPDRWLTLRPSPYAYLPFGAGPRHCLGGPLALVIMSLVIPMVWGRFRMRVQPQARIEANAVATMLAPMTEVPMQLLAKEEPLARVAISGNLHRYVDMHATK